MSFDAATRTASFAKHSPQPQERAWDAAEAFTRQVVQAQPTEWAHDPQRQLTEWLGARYSLRQSAEWVLSEAAGQELHGEVYEEWTCALGATVDQHRTAKAPGIAECWRTCCTMAERSMSRLERPKTTSEGQGGGGGAWVWKVGARVRKTARFVCRSCHK